MVAVLPPSTKKKHKSNAQSGRPAGSPFFMKTIHFRCRAQPITVRCCFDSRFPFCLLSRLYTDTVPPTHGSRRH